MLSPDVALVKSFLRAASLRRRKEILELDIKGGALQSLLALQMQDSDPVNENKDWWHFQVSLLSLSRLSKFYNILRGVTHHLAYGHFQAP